MEYLLDAWGVETLDVKQEMNSTLFLYPNPKDMATQEAPHIGHLIKKELARQGRTVTWLAAQLNYSRQHMYYLLGHGFIYTDLLLKISELMDYDFFGCYTDYLKQKKLSWFFWHFCRKICIQNDLMFATT